MANETLQTRYMAVFGFNTKQWWAYDEQDDCYIDVPIEVLDQIKEHSDDIDKQQDFFNQILDTLPSWLNDEDYKYFGDMDI